MPIYADARRPKLRRPLTAFAVLATAGLVLVACKGMLPPINQQAALAENPTPPAAQSQKPTAATQTPAPLVTLTTPAPHSAEFFVSNASPIGPSSSDTGSGKAAPSGDQVTLNFLNADVHDLIRAVLGDILKVPFVIDPRVTGTVTVQSGQTIDRDAVLPVLEDVLRLSGIAIVRANGVYNVVQAADAPRFALPEPEGQGSRVAGFSVRVIPLRYTAADDLLNVMKSVMPSDMVVRVVPSRNVLIAAGTQRELAGIADFVSLFDVDAFKGMSFALFYPQNVDAKSLVKELETVFNNQKAGTNVAIRFSSIDRLNAILAASRTPAYLTDARDWVERLDKKSASVDERIFVYSVQNGRASDLAATLNSIFAGRTDRASQSGAGHGPEIGSEALPAPPPPAGAPPAAVAPGAAALPATPVSLPGPGLQPDAGIPLIQGRPPQITADEIHNALVIMTTPRVYQVIEAALAKLDVPPLQVLIEAVVAEVTLTNNLQYGVQWFLKTGNSANLTLSNNASGTTAATFPGFAAILSKGKNITSTLSALQSITTVHVLSSPQLMVINNQTATLQVGNQVPIATQSAVSVVTTGAPVVNTIQYRDTGVILKVTPRVNAGGHVQMDVVQEVSDVTNTTTSGIDSPTIEQRKFNSAVSVESGDTIVLGGVIQDKRSLGDNGIPLLKDIPLVGNLFKTTTDADNRTEVIVLITPQVVTNEVDIGRVTDDFRRRLQEMAAPQMH